MGKLIRDLIPELFPETSQRPLQGDEVTRALLRKLVEEAVEAWRSPDAHLLEELGDVLEVLKTILKVRGLEWSDLEQAAGIKAAARGGFDRALFAEELPDGLDFDLLNSPMAPLAPSLIDAFENRRISHIDLAVSFIMDSGLTVIEQAIVSAVDRGASIRILATDYLGITSRSALRRLLSRQGERLQVRLFRDPTTSYHPKAYLFASPKPEHPAFGFVGSSNLSRSALEEGVEWTVRTTDPVIVNQMRGAFQTLWDDKRSSSLTQELLDSYVESSRDRVAKALTETVEPPVQPVSPTALQQDVLRLLAETRLNGFSSGLVVLATGLGKTWVAAFDSARPEFRSVLFVAPRREILFQARDTIQRIHADKSVGLLADGVAELDADIVLATVDSLRNRLREIPGDRFDYVVIDEFHHAAAASYRAIINHLMPKFLLGLTATPLRTDGADLLGLCENNLVVEVDLIEGISQELLAPFRYRGVADPVDFKPIPWRNGQFDISVLEHALANEARADAAFEAWERVRGSRGIFFCASQRHADWTAQDLARRGVNAVAVHSGPSSAPRAESLERLRRGALDALVSVDMFTEGLDLPSLDSIVMLRPTESPVVFLQQLGRGLRRSEGKDHLEVIDFVGNHRSFLARPKLLLSMGQGSRPSDAELMRVLKSGDWTLPEGCLVEYDVEAIDLIATLARSARVSGPERVREFIRQYCDEHGRRPTATQALQAGVNPGALRPSSWWLEELADLEMLTDQERSALGSAGDFLQEVERTSMTRSFKMVTLRALIENGTASSVPWRELAMWSLEIVRRDPRLHNDVSQGEVGDVFTVDPARWQAYWRKNPIAAWIGEDRREANAWFQLEGDAFTPRFQISPGDVEGFFSLLDELVEYRLASYLMRSKAQDMLLLRVSHAGEGRPIIMLDRQRHPEIPMGPTPLRAAGQVLEAHFVKIALNKVTKPSQDKNVLPSLLVDWFGAEAGQPGSAHFVVLERDGGNWNMRPAQEEAATATAI